MAGGQAEPPITVRLSVEKRRLVGLHVAQQHLPDRGHAGGDRSPSRPRSVHRPTCRPAPGRGTPAWQPTSAAEYGMPQALTWNIGTTGSTESRADRHITSGKRRGVGVQDGGAMAVQRRLRVAGGAAGVAHARSRVLVEAGPCVAGGLAADPGFVAHQVGDAAVLGQLVRHRTAQRIAGWSGSARAPPAPAAGRSCRSTAPGPRRGWRSRRSGPDAGAD